MITLALGLLLAFYLLWILYLATMSIERARRAGTITKPALGMAVPFVLVGLTIDIAINVVPMTFFLFELPQEKTTSERLRRLNRDPGTNRYRKAVVRLFEPLLDPFDPSGDHI